MDQTYISALAELGVSLATMAASGTATAININFHLHLFEEYLE